MTVLRQIIALLCKHSSTYDCKIKYKFLTALSLCSIKNGNLNKYHSIILEKLTKLSNTHTKKTCKTNILKSYKNPGNVCQPTLI